MRSLRVAHLPSGMAVAVVGAMTKAKTDDIFPTLSTEELATCTGGNQGMLTQNAIQSQQNAAQNLTRSGIRPGGGGGGGGNEMPVN